MKYPFKFLDSYGKDDSDIFFGRDMEIELLYKMTFETNVVWLYGASGTGKTSLVQCGLARKFNKYEWHNIRITRGNNITESLDKALSAAINTETAVNEEIDRIFQQAGKASGSQAPIAVQGEPGLAISAAMANKISPDSAVDISPLERKIRSIYLQHFKPLYLIFDQFEELFILGTKEEYNEFVTTMAILLKTEYPVKIIIVIREEYLGYLYELEKSAPQLLKKKLRIEPVDYEKVHEILSGISGSGDSLIKFEEGKSNEVIREIFNKAKDNNRSTTIQLPYLQVFLDKLYNTITGDEKKQSQAEFSMAALNRMGHINNVLRDFLEDQVAATALEICEKFPMITPKVVWGVLSPFVSLENTKEPISLDDLYLRIDGLTNITINHLIGALYTRRIIRPSQDSELWELAHDSLAERIAEKRDSNEVALLEKRTFIESKVKVFAQTAEMFSAKEITLVTPFLEKLIKRKLIKKEAIDLINNSKKKLAAEKEEEEKRQKNLAEEEAEKKNSEERKKLDDERRTVKLEKQSQELQLANAQIEIAKSEMEVQNKRMALEAKEIRYNKRRNKLRYIALACLLGIVITAGLLTFFSIKSSYKTSEENRYWLIANSLLRSDNPTLGYLAIREGLQRNNTSDTLNKQLAELQSSDFIYLQGVYVANSNVSNVSLNKNLMVIDGDQTKTIWNTNSRAFVRSEKHIATNEELKFKITNGMRIVRQMEDAVEIKDENAKMIARIPTDDYFTPALIKISGNGQLLLLGTLLYDLEGRMRNHVPQVSRKIPGDGLTNEPDKEEKYEPTASFFLKDNRMAIGYSNGSVAIFSYDSKRPALEKVGHFSFSDFLNNETNIVLQLQTDRNERMLFVNSQDRFGVGNLNQVKSALDKSPAKDLNDLNIEELQNGHNGQVTYLTFSNSDSLMLSGSVDNSAILWDISTTNVRKIATLKGPNSAQIVYGGFYNNDKDIITVTESSNALGEASKIYYWKRGWPATVGYEQEVYRFSPLNFAAAGLTGEMTTKFGDTSLAHFTTADLYRFTLDYYLNLPASNPFPNEEGYSQILERALTAAENAYQQLITRSDYSKIIDEKADRVLALCRLVHLPRIYQDLERAKKDRENWREFLSDTINNLAPSPVIVLPKFTAYTEEKNYSDAFKLLRYYNDSVWHPLFALYEHNRDLANLKRNIDLSWNRYYIYTRDSAQAFRIAKNLSSNPSKITDYNFYLVATYLSFGKYIEAANIYINMKKNLRPTVMFHTNSSLSLLLTKIRDKGIGVTDIDRFRKEFDLKYLEYR